MRLWLSCSDFRAPAITCFLVRPSKVPARAVIKRSFANHEKGIGQAMDLHGFRPSFGIWAQDDLATGSIVQNGVVREIEPDRRQDAASRHGLARSHVNIPN
jgi:hypothetical protein